jgi:hypothetical protein
VIRGLITACADTSGSPCLARTRPAVLFGRLRETCPHGVVLDIVHYALPFRLVPDSMVAGFLLPERCASSSQHSVSFVRCIPFQRFHKKTRGNLRQHQDMYVVRHDHEGARFILARIDSSLQRFEDPRGSWLLLQESRPEFCAIEVAIDPDESLSRRKVRGRVLGFGQASGQMPRREQPAVVGIDVREPAAGVHLQGVLRTAENSLAPARVPTWHARVRAPRGFR